MREQFYNFTRPAAMLLHFLVIYLSCNLVGPCTWSMSGMKTL